MDISFDSILTQLGTGRWNILHYIIIWFWYSLVSYHTLGGAFLAPDVRYTCRPPPHALTASVVVYPSDVPASEANFTYNPDDQLINQNACTYPVRNHSTDVEEEPCTEWDFDNSTYASTVTSEFQLVCDKKYLRATYQSIYMFGTLVGAGFNGFLADRFGRWTMIAISSTIYTITAVGSGWLPYLSTILVARFLLGAMHPTSLQTGFVLVMEVTELKMRSAIGMLQFLTWSMGTMLWGGFAYFVRDWRWLQLTVSLPGLLFFPIFWLLDESPRWLIIRGQHERALRVLEKAAKQNKVTLPSKAELLRIMEEIQHKSLSVDGTSTVGTTTSKVRYCLSQVVLLLRTPKLCIITISMCVDYFVVAMVFFGLGLGASTLQVDPYLYMVISGLLEIPSTTVIIPFVSWFGRKRMTEFSFFVCGVALLSQPLVPQDYKWLSVTLVMIGKLSSTTAFSIIFLYASELYPTEIRTRGMSAVMMSSRAGAIVSPYLMSALSSTYPWAITVVFGLAAMLAVVATMPLSETLNMDLPDTIMDVEDKQGVFYRSSDTKSGTSDDQTTSC
ncbi:organic cation transporter protein-like [Panulirus ornatus]|uniref:organic cation transporter protein-like n=1 Tax=Panulirus ornatus TaxID=150431 RepID=UPI003A880D03